MSLQVAAKGSPLYNHTKIKLLEKEIKILKEKVRELTTENATLREINVKFQIENFNLQKKVTQLENSSHEISEIIYEDDQNTEDDADEATKIMLEKEEDEMFEEILYENDADIEESSAEYLEEVYETSDIDKNKNLEQSKSAKRRFSETFECYEEESDHASKKEDKQSKGISYEITILDEEEIGDIEDIKTITEPKDAMAYVYKLASKRNCIHKLKEIKKGRQKDSAFVSKVLDLLYDKVTLASSSAQGQKCQSKLHLPAKPALDQDRLEICKKAFIFRLKSENTDQEDKQQRLKLFLKLVNDKIQNCRKCLNRTDSSKLLEL